MIKKLMFKGKPSDQQAEAHAMCREGLTNYKPKLTSPKMERGSLPKDMLEALHEIEKQLTVGQWLPSMEIYADDGAFNVWVAYNQHPEAVGLFTYRRDS